MKYGGNKLNELVNFYKNVITYSELNKLVNVTNNINWVDIFDEENSKITIGVSQLGKWVLKNEQNFYVLDDKIYLYCVRVLEIPYNIVKMKIEDRFFKIFEKENVDVNIIFPFCQIIEFTLNNLLDDYWFELAMKWYENLEFSLQQRLMASLEVISKAMKISQKNRQYAKKELKKHNKLGNIIY